MGKGGQKGKAKGGKNGAAEEGQKGKAKGDKKGTAEGEEVMAVTDLHKAARSGDMEQVQQLLAKASLVQINAIDNHRRTPLHLAAFSGHVSAVACLVEQRANAWGKATDGYLPLHFAVQQGHLEVVKALLLHVSSSEGDDADPVRTYVNRVLPKGKKSPLHLAVQKGFDALAQLLALNGASLELKTGQGQSVDDLCQSETLRASLRSASATAAVDAPPAKEGAQAQGLDARSSSAGVGSEEPPAKRRAVEAEVGVAGAAAGGEPPLPVVLISMRQWPAEGTSTAATTKEEGVLSCGPMALEDIRVSALELERVYPPGIAAIAEVHWDTEVEDNPALQDGPVWCLAKHTTPSEAAARHLELKLQRTSHKLVAYTHLSDEAETMIADETLRSNACGVTLLAQTADGLLVLHKPKAEGRLWQTWPCSCLLGSSDLGRMLQEMLKEMPGVGDVAAALASVKLLALVDEGTEGASKSGCRHGLVFTARLAEKADDVMQACMATGEPLFVRTAGATKDEDILAVDLGTALGANFALAQTARRALQLFRELYVGL